ARTARGKWAVDRHLAPAPAPRRVLAPRFCQRGLRRRAVPRARRERLGRWLLPLRLPVARAAARATQGADRPVGTHVSAPGRARPRDRVPAGGRPLVGPLAERRR